MPVSTFLSVAPDTFWIPGVDVTSVTPGFYQSYFHTTFVGSFSSEFRLKRRINGSKEAGLGVYRGKSDRAPAKIIMISLVCQDNGHLFRGSCFRQFAWLIFQL